MPSADLIRKELDERAANNLIDFVTNTATLVFEQSFDYTTDFPGFIAAPTDEPGPFGVAKAIARQSCRRWARGEGIPSLPGFDAFYGGICKPYLETLGEYPTGGDIGPEFEGGQCSGALYRIDYEYTNGDDNYLPAVIFLRGPLSVDRSPEPGDDTASCPPGTSFTRKNLVGFNGEKRVLNSGCNTKSRILSVSPFEGAPNNCGNTAPTYEPPVVRPGLPPLPPINVNVPGIGDVAVDVSFDDDGNINISLPDLGLGIKVPNPLAGDGDGGDDEEVPGDQGQPGLPAVGDETGAAEGGDNDRALVGVLVETTETPPRANQIFNQTETYTKGAYFVYFGGDAGYSQNPEAAITTQEQFFYAPEGSNRFRVVPNVDFTILVTPYYKRED